MTDTNTPKPTRTISANYTDDAQLNGVIELVEVNGTTRKGEFKVDGNLIAVFSGSHQKTTHISGSDPLTLAEMMMGEFVWEGK